LTLYLLILTEKFLTLLNGTLKAKYPEAYKGAVRFEREGYMSDIRREPFYGPVSVQLRRVRNFSVRIRRYRVNVDSQKQSYDSKSSINTYQIEGWTTQLTNKERAMITLKKVKDEYDPFGEFPSQFFMCNRTECTPFEKVNIIPGKYEVTITYIRDETYTIPKHCKHICVKKALQIAKCTEKRNKEYFKMPNEDMELMYIGGLKLNEETRHWEVTEAELDNMPDHRYLAFFFITLPEATCIDNECELSRCITPQEVGTAVVDDYGVDFYDTLKPQWPQY
jgi:hypothetical protein